MRPYTLFCLAVLTSSSLFAMGSSALAQTRGIVVDDSMGVESSTVRTVTPRVQVIEDGAQRGGALFHSFEEFNIDQGWTANFANPEGVFNILSRVTGENPSDLFGTLGVLGEADLFFINPNGVVFGPNASLNIPGSLTVSTADSFVLPDGFEFSATDPGAVPLLSVGVEAPIGVQFGEGMVAALENEALLEVGEDLTLSAGDVVSNGVLFAPEGDVLVEGRGDVRVQEVAAQSAVLSASENLVLEESRLQTAGDLSLLAGDTVRVRDSEETPFSAISEENLLIRGDQQIDILALNHLESVPFQSGEDLILMSDGSISGDAHFTSNGSFLILDLLYELTSFTSFYDPVIVSGGDVRLASYGLEDKDGNGEADGAASLMIRAVGDIEVVGGIFVNSADDNLSCSSECSDELRSDYSILANSPSVILRAGLSPSMLELPPNVASTSLSRPGNIQVGYINTEGRIGNVILESRNRGDITVSGQFGDELSIDGGSITMDTLGDIVISEDLSVRRDIPGDVGDIAIGTNLLPASVTVGAISSRHEGNQGNGGNVTIKTSGELRLQRAFGISDLERPNTSEDPPSDIVSVISRARDDGGTIALEADDGIFTVGGIVSRSTGLGRGGDIYLESSDGPIGLGYINSDGIVASGNIEFGNIDSSGMNGGGKICLTAGISAEGNGCAGEGLLTSEVVSTSDIDAFVTINDVESRITSASNNRKAGIISIAARNQIMVPGEIRSDSEGVSGRNVFRADTSGDVTLISREGGINISNDGVISSRTRSGDAGDVRLIASGNIDIEGNIFAGSSQSGTNDENLNSGNSDTVSIVSDSAITLRNAFILTSTTGGIREGSESNLINRGNVIIEAPRIEIVDNSRVITDSYNQAITNGDVAGQDAGFVSIGTSEENDTITIDQSRISTVTRNSPEEENKTHGNAGDITIGSSSTQAIGILNQSRVEATSRGGRFEPTRNPELADNIHGLAGNVSLTARQITLANDSLVSSSNVEANVATRVDEEKERSEFGNVFLNVDALSVTDSLISADTRRGIAGDVIINGLMGEVNGVVSPAQSVTLSGTVSPQLYQLDNAEDRVVSEDSNGAGVIARARGGQAGNAVVIANRLIIGNEARIAVSSRISGVTGNVFVRSNDVRLRNQAQIIASTGSSNEQDFSSVFFPVNISSLSSLFDFDQRSSTPGNEGAFENDGQQNGGGNIVIGLDNTHPIFWMRNNSLINANAERDADGGNIALFTTQDDGFVISIPSENSDIEARAVSGDGGGVFFGNTSLILLNEIDNNNNTLSEELIFPDRTYVFGLRVRADETDLSDILVTSEDGALGFVLFSDPIEDGFLELEEELLLPSDPNLDEGCQIGSSSRQAAFFDIGLGGAPPSTDELLNGNNILSEWIPLDIEESDTLTVEPGSSTEALSFNVASTAGLNLLALCTANE